MPTEPAASFALIVAFVVVGNALIWGLLAWRHAQVRAELARGQTLFRERDVRVTISGWSPLGVGISWMRAEVWITDRSAVLLLRQIIGMPQPPIALFRSRQEAAASRRWLISRIVVGELMLHPAEHAVTIRSRGGFIRRKLKLRPYDPQALTAALEACLNRQAPGGERASIQG